MTSSQFVPSWRLLSKCQLDIVEYPSSTGMEIYHREAVNNSAATGIYCTEQLISWGRYFAANIFKFPPFLSITIDVSSFHISEIFVIRLTINNKPAVSFSDNGLVLNRRHTIICANDSLVYWHICASLDFNGLTQHSLDQDRRQEIQADFRLWKIIMPSQFIFCWILPHISYQC